MAVALPMESNPDIMTMYLKKLGVSANWRMVDVMGLDDDLLNWVPQPVLAVILLFPLSEAYEKHRCEQETELNSQGFEPPKDVFHLKQVISNICGTIALVHSVANNISRIEVNDGPLKDYLTQAKDLDATNKGELLQDSTAILDAYRDLVRATVEEGAELEESNNHFVTFIHHDGYLYELDGRKAYPIKHGPTSPEKLLQDTAEVCREFIAREPDNIGFNIVALVPAE